MSKPKLHELLAVEGDLEGTYKKILEETTTTFAKKPGHFFGYIRHLEMDEDGIENEVVEQQELTTTVSDKLEYSEGHIIRYLNAVLQKEATNQVAVADLIIDGVTIAEALPATFLLGMEAKLKFIRKMFEAMPTLPNGIKWELDETRGDDIWATKNPEIKPKTKKMFKSTILVPAQFPKEGESGTSLPAQIEKWEETENVGRYVKTTWSGMITSARKSVILGHIDTLLRAFKKARQRANSTQVVKREIGEVLFNYINT